MSDDRDTCDQCIDHGPDFALCTECGLKLDAYGNTEADFRFCCYPNCGCDGARLCMAPSGASDRSAAHNVEGMYRSASPVDRMRAYGDILTNK